MCVLGVNEFCTPESPCFECEEREHRNLHPSMDDPECRTCRMRSVQLNPRTVAPTSKNNVAPARNTSSNAWEQGIATDHRGVPYLDENCAPIGVKKLAANRSRYEGALRKHRTVGV